MTLQAPGAGEMVIELNERQRRMPRSRDASRAGRDRSRPPPGGADAAEEQQEANEPGSRARSRPKVVTRRRAQWRADHGLPPREEEWAQEAAARAAAAAQQDEEEVELGQADFGTDYPPRGEARWRHGGDKSEHVPRAAEPDVPVSYDSPGVAMKRKCQPFRMCQHSQMMLSQWHVSETVLACTREPIHPG